MGAQAGGAQPNLEENVMHTILGLSSAIAAQRIADLHRQATEDRLARLARAGRERTAHGRRGWKRLTFQRRRPAMGATQS